MVARLGLGLKGNMETTNKENFAPRWRDIAARIIYKGYPHSDLLSIDPPREGESICDFAVRAGDAGDALFLFLCCEANEDIDTSEYVHRLDRALGDIEQVRRLVLVAERVHSWLTEKPAVPLS